MSDNQKESVTKPTSYGERDAVVTMFSVGFNVPEEHAREVIEDIMHGDDKSAQRAIVRLTAKVKKRFERIADDKRREWATRIGRAIAYQIREMALKQDPFLAPAVRDSIILKLIGLVLPRRIVAQRFVPILSDLYIELEEAQQEGPLQVLVVRLAYTVRFMKACGFHILLAVLDWIMKIIDFLS